MLRPKYLVSEVCQGAAEGSQSAFVYNRRMHYWLLKTEPDGFSIDDLLRVKKEAWTGVRNFGARNYMMQMQKGDLCLMYHTGNEKQIVGLGKVASDVYPDPTQFDKESHYFEPRSTKEKPTWKLVDIAFVKKFKKTMSLAEIKNDPALSGMVLVKAPRLSVQPVSEKQFKYIMEQLS